jgi:DHA1 family multidrug resistance protein-like MFS transporter
MTQQAQSQHINEFHPTIRRSALQIITRAIFLISLPFGILYFVLPVFGEQIGADAIEIGLFFSAFSLMTVLLRPVVGVALDRYGRRPFFTAGLLGYALTMATFALARDVQTILMARLMQGSASSLLWLTADSIAADVADPNERGGAFGGIGQASTAGTVLGTFVGFGMLSMLSFLTAWKWLFRICGGLCVLAALWAMWRLPESYRPVQRSQQPIPWSRQWLLLLLVTLVTGASAAMIAPIIMIFLQRQLSASIEDLAWAALPAALIVATFQSRLGALADRLGRKPLMVVSVAAAGLTSFIIPRLTQLLQLAAVWALQDLCYAAGDPAEQALVADLTGGDQRGRAYGLYAMAAGLGMTIGPVAGGWLYERLGPQAPFVANGLILGMSALLLGVWLREPRRVL